MYLYMIGAFSPKKLAFIKVGVTKDIDARIKHIQTGQAFEVRVINAWKAKSRLHAFDKEANVHREFGKFRVNGEWYRDYMIRRLRKYITQEMGEEPCIAGSNAKAARRSEKVIPEQGMRDLRSLSWLRANGF